MQVPLLVKRIYAEFSDDRIPAVAGGITFFFLLALFPAITCIVSLYGLFAERATIMKGLDLVSGFLPGGATSILRGEIHRLVLQPASKLSIAVFFGFIVAVWSASGGVKALLDGLNIAFETKETRSFLRLTINALALTIIGALTTSAAIYVAVTISDLIARSGYAGILGILFDIVAWPAGFFICSTLISVVYRYGANRARTPWRWISWGSGLAAGAWIIGTLLFTWYVQKFGRYDRTYGDLGAAVGFLTWVWLSLVILLTGAEVVSVIEQRQR